MGWSRAKIEVDTAYLTLPNGERHCAYCGKIIEPDTEWDDYDKYEYFHCDCEDAKKEINLCLQLRKLDSEYFEKKKELELQFPKPKLKFKTVLVPIEDK